MTLDRTSNRGTAALAVLFALALLFALAACQPAQQPATGSSAPVQPYAGHQDREVKALAPDVVDDLLAGRGAGYALAAELNHYPGPTHALELADELGLSGEQRDAISAVKAAMTEEARRLGAELVEGEAKLDAAFAAGEIDDQDLRGMTGTIAEVEGRLRATHLAAHIETRALLSEAQVVRYDELRGYGASDVPASHGGGHQGGEDGD